MKVAIIGAGLIGCERIKAVKQISSLSSKSIELLVFDKNSELLESVGLKHDIKIIKNIEEILSENPNWVFICTPHDMIKDIAIKSLKIGASLLIEKPFGRDLSECDEILSFKPESSEIYIGFNYRFFTGIEAVIRDTLSGKFGDIISVNLILGHGNSPGIEKTWKLDPIRCGGGCLIDPGVHLLDIILQLSNGDLSICGGKSWSGFWKTGIEEEAHICFSDKKNTIFNMQVSLNRWRSTFRIEINGTDGYGIVEGRGRSYGNQSYRTGTRWGWQSGKSQIDSEIIEIENYSAEDSFLKETVMIIAPELAGQFGVLASLPCNEKQAREVMVLLDKCKTKLNLTN